MLAADSNTVGRFDSEDDVILAGAFEGKLLSSRSVQLLAGSHLKGDVLAAEIVVHGQVTGNLLARQRIRILEGGNVSGEICAPQVTVQEGVALNGRVRMLSSDHETREYLLPVLLRTESGAAPRPWQELLSSTEEFLEHMGFLIETRAKPGTLMRCIFRTREPMTYAQFFERLNNIDAELRKAAEAAPDAPSPLDEPPADRLATRFLEALGDTEGAVGVLGSTVVVVGDVPNGAPQRSVESRSEILPEPGLAEISKPGDLLLELQRIHAEVLGETAQ
ncbi:MAG: polymer-forming cytoskeletal protein, partial [Gammaproteobacteria bacterium]|nr:polymer-forming cytoskeletal protein [Gammaproteobacteria bacterium]